MSTTQLTFSFLEKEPVIIEIPSPVEPVDGDELFSSLPFILNNALNCLLSEFDYPANLESNTSIAIRLLATTMDRLQRVTPCS